MVYFLQPADGGPIKIGCSKDVEARRKQLESDYRRSLVLLATLPGGHAEERAIHERFSHIRLGKTEQFKPTTELMTFIGCPLLVDPNPNAVEAMPFGPYRRYNTLVRLDDEVIKQAKKVAALMDITLAEYLSNMIRPLVASDFNREVKKLKEGGDSE